MNSSYQQLVIYTCYRGACLEHRAIYLETFELVASDRWLNCSGAMPLIGTAYPRVGWLLRQVAVLHSDHYRQVPLVGAGCFRQVAALHSDHHRQVPLVGAGCFRQVAALHSDHHRQVPLVGAGCFRQVAALHSDHYRQVPLVGAGCFRQVAELSNHHCMYSKLTVSPTHPPSTATHSIHTTTSPSHAHHITQPRPPHGPYPPTSS